MAKQSAIKPVPNYKNIGAILNYLFTTHEKYAELTTNTDVTKLSIVKKLLKQFIIKLKSLMFYLINLRKFHLY